MEIDKFMDIKNTVEPGALDFYQTLMTKEEVKELLIYLQMIEKGMSNSDFLD